MTRINSKLTAAFAAVLCAVTPLIGCGARSVTRMRHKTSAEYFGTVSMLSVKGDADEAWAEILDDWRVMDETLSVYKEGSDLKRFNDAEAGSMVPIDKLTAELCVKAGEVRRLSDGAFNPAVAGLVDLWAFSPRFRNGGGEAMPYDRVEEPGGGYLPPPDDQIEKFKRLALFDYAPVLTKQGYFLSKPYLTAEIGGRTFTAGLDFGGIAKGAAADRAAAILERRGIREGYVSVGRSSIAVLGEAGVDVAALDPLQPDTPYIKFFACRRSVSTSGCYENRYTAEGREYSHIIDGRTGRPVPYGSLSATVIGGEAVMGDALATALCVMSVDEARGFLAGGGVKAALLRLEEGKLKLYTNMTPNSYELYTDAEVEFIDAV